MSVTPNILATARVPFGVAQIVEWRWPSPMDVTACESAHMIEMPLPPLAADGTASFPDISPQRFSVMGSLFLRPAGVMIRARSPGGHIRVVRLAAEPARFAEIAGGEIRRDEAVLRTALDLRADRPRLLLHRIRDELTSPGFGSDALIEAYGAALMIERCARCSAKPNARAARADWRAGSIGGCATGSKARRRRQQCPSWRACAGSAYDTSCGSTAC
jgi:AraC family transcriptional regulator